MDFNKTYIDPAWLDELKENPDITLDQNEEKACEYIKKIVQVDNTTTCNGTSALYLGMKALGLKEGDEIILPAFSYRSFLTCSKTLGLKVKFVDIKPDTFCMNPEELKKAITKETKVVGFINHLGYVGPDIEEIVDIANSCNSMVIEDSAQAIGQYHKNKHAGTFGVFGILSFSGTKTIRTGEGGAFMSTNKLLVDKVKQLKSVQMGMGNYTMSGTALHFLRKQLEIFPDIIDKRIAIFGKFQEREIPIAHPFVSRFYNNAVVKSTDMTLKKLQIWKIPFRFKGPYECFDENCPVSKEVNSKYLEIPSSYDLTDSDISKIEISVSRVK